MRRFYLFLRHALSLVVCVSIVLAFAPASEAGRYKKEYKMTLNVGPTFYWGMGAKKFAELVKQKTNGRININPYYGSALLKGVKERN